VSFHAQLSCDAPGCTASLKGRSHPGGMRRRAQSAGWVGLDRERLDYCPDHRDYDRRVAQRADREDAERAILDAVFGAQQQ